MERVETSSYKDQFYPGDIISCAVKGHEDFRSPSVYAPKLPSVSVSPSAEIVEDSSVTLTCSSDANPAAKYTWYKENQTLIQGPEDIYNFTSISSKDSGIYHCKSENEYGQINSTSVSIDVQYAPKLPSVSVSPSAEIVEGSSVTLTCSSDANPAANYTWYKENQTPLQELQGIYHFNSISSEDRGIYHCKSENQYGQINSTSLFVDVHYAPKLPSVSVSPSAEIVEGSSVTLTCSSDANPAAKYTWYKENQTLIQGPEDIYHFTSISSKDSGIYHCKSENELGQINSTSVSIDVQYAPKLPSVSVSPSAEIVENSTVTLTCSSDANPAAKYTWYKENEDSPKASGQNFTITDFRAEHSGNYYCEAQNRKGRHNSTLHLIVVAGTL
ncbi:B-cell receptor CD22-like [Micropterus salmoides]|uniref:B-cell receptor CD22-like n=1 Tax=Micropterus salmoides TaxID=27706 RepID=UPI0018EB59B6|nr:B-cell receptor CD22-like [Micropterus salmoides]